MMLTSDLQLSSADEESLVFGYEAHVSCPARFEILQTTIKSRKKGNSFYIFLGSFIVVFERAFVSFGAGASQVVVIAELVVFCAAFYLVDDCGVDCDSGVQTTWSWDPGYFRFCWSWRRSRFLNAILLDCDGRSCFWGRRDECHACPGGW
jgi:hypothetical protein